MHNEKVRRRTLAVTAVAAGMLIALLSSGQTFGNIPSALEAVCDGLAPDGGLTVGDVQDAADEVHLSERLTLPLIDCLNIIFGGIEPKFFTLIFTFFVIA
jgi:hypothetical protein